MVGPWCFCSQLWRFRLPVLILQTDLLWKKKKKEKKSRQDCFLTSTPIPGMVRRRNGNFVSSLSNVCKISLCALGLVGLPLSRQPLQCPVSAQSISFSSKPCIFNVALTQHLAISTWTLEVQVGEKKNECDRKVWEILENKNGKTKIRLILPKTQVKERCGKEKNNKLSIIQA